MQNRYAEIFGEDPWADLAANPLRPTEVGGKLSRLEQEMVLRLLIHLYQDSASKLLPSS